MDEDFKLGFVERFTLTFGGVVVSHGNRSTLYVILSGAKAKPNFWRRSRQKREAKPKRDLHPSVGIETRKGTKNADVHSPTVGGDPASASPRALPWVGFDFTDITP